MSTQSSKDFVSWYGFGKCSQIYINTFGDVNEFLEATVYSVGSPLG